MFLTVLLLLNLMASKVVIHVVVFPQESFGQSLLLPQFLTVIDLAPEALRVGQLGIDRDSVLLPRGVVMALIHADLHQWSLLGRLRPG